MGISGTLFYLSAVKFNPLVEETIVWITRPHTDRNHNDETHKERTIRQDQDYRILIEADYYDRPMSIHRSGPELHDCYDLRIGPRLGSSLGFSDVSKSVHI